MTSEDTKCGEFSVNFNAYQYTLTEKMMKITILCAVNEFF